MRNFNHRRDCGKRISNQSEFRHSTGARLLVLFLCLSMLAGFLPSQTAAADGEPLMLADYVTFDSGSSIVYMGGALDGKEVAGGDLIVKGQELQLRYEYTILPEQCEDILPDTPYYLDVSRHLQLPDLGSDVGKLCMTVEDGPGAEKEVQFGTLHADGEQAWVVFCAAENAAENNAQTVISEQGGLEKAYFYLDCTRAEDVPEGECPIEGCDNRYVMKFESRELAFFGYAEHEPVTAQAEIEKKGVLNGKTITWSIEYTPWQNPAAGDGVTEDTAFELRDTLNSSWNSVTPFDIRIDTTSVTIYNSRDEIPSNAETYALIDTLENDDMTLIIGGTKLQAGNATQGTPAEPLKITYQTMIREELLLPGDSTDKKVTNAVELFADGESDFYALGICASGTVIVKQPAWITKKGTTKRNVGYGSTTDWTVTFDPNGFDFTDANELTFYDQFPDSSALVDDSVKIEVGEAVSSAAIIKDSSDGFVAFRISPIETPGQPVTITYQTKVEEKTYENGEDLGNNTAWFTFKYDEQDYEIPKVISPVSSGTGTGSGTARIEKTALGYDAKTRTIGWKVTINPHKANLKGGTFTDDLKVGPACLLQGSGHTSGLELVDDIQVQVDGAALLEADKDKVTLKYDNRTITVQVDEIGAKTITLKYKTRVCDPCIFANNTQKKSFKNTISTENMVIGSNDQCSASASATADVSATVLTKKVPVYDYKTGIMTWTVEVDAAGPPMTGVVLTDELPAGLSYVDQSLQTDPAISGASASVNGQELTINLGDVSKKTTVKFQTRADAQTLGFGGDQPVTVKNTIRMNGKAYGVEFQPVLHTVSQTFANHGLVKTGSADVKNGWIRYEVLINPYGLALPAQPMIVDTLDRRLQLDTDTLCLYSATLDGTTAGSEKPGYTKTIGTERKLQISAYDLATNSFTVQLPINADDRGAYVLTYTADIIQQEKGVYNNSVRFEGGVTMKLGGTKNNETTVSGGGGGGGGAVSRKATISIEKKDEETGSPLAGVTFTLYQWDASGSKRGIAFAQGTTGADGRLFFRVKPGAAYELVETMPVTGYSKVFTCANLQSLSGVTKTQDGLLILAGAATSELKLDLTNKHLTGGSGSGGSSGGGGSSENGGGFGGGGTDPGTSDTPDDPDKTDGSNKKEDPDDLDEKDDFGKKDNTNTKDKPDKGKKPNKTNKSPKSDKSDKSDRKDKTDQKSTSGKSGQSGSSVNAGASDQTSASGKKGLSGQTGSSVNTGTSKQSSASGKTGFSGQTSSSNDSGASDRTDSSGDPDIPQTGDNTPWLAAVVLLSGILLVVMSCYQLFRLKKREKR